MKEIASFFILVSTSCMVFGDNAMQPPLVEYDYCNSSGTICTKTTFEFHNHDGVEVPVVGGVLESNTDQLLNLDHFYRNQCSNELGVDKNESVPMHLKSLYGKCLIDKLSIAIKNRNKENLEYLNETKLIFK